jgi:hypothetical protein
MKEPLYTIQVSWKIGSTPFNGYLEINPTLQFVSKKIDATLFKSKALAYGWMLKAKVLYKNTKFSVVIV